MKFKGLLFTTVAMLGLASCSSDNDTIDSIIGSDKDLMVNVSIPNASSTRGIIEDGVTSKEPVVDTDNVWAYIIRDKVKVAVKKVEFDAAKKGSARFSNLTIKENDKVVISGNTTEDEDELISPIGYEIATVQPTKNSAGVKSILYFGEKKVKSDNNESEIEGSKIKLLTVQVELAPQAARTEVSGNIRINPKLVASATVDQITLNNYHEIFGSKETFKATINNLGKLALKNEESDSEKFYDIIKDGSKVVANHIFNKDEKRITFRLNATIYDVVKIKDLQNKKLKNQIIDPLKPQSYIFKGKNDKFYVEADPQPLQEIDKLIELVESEDGTIVIEGKKYTKSTNELADLTQLKTYSTVVDAPSVNGPEVARGYFQLVKFAPLNADGHFSSEHLYYKQGNIYKISFDKIDWNRDGKANDNDHFSPGDEGQDGEDGGNGSIDPTPTDNKYDVAVGAEILGWIAENVGSSIE